MASGHRVLDVATGTGAAARLALEMAGPLGLGGDISPAMLSVARRKLAGLPVALANLDAEALPFRAKVFDSVVCQLRLMFFADPARGLSEFHRVLRDDGWTAVSITTRLDRSLFGRIGAVIARYAPEKAEKLNRFFAISDSDCLRALIAGAGFREVSTRAERRAIEFASFNAYFGGIERGATLSGQEFIQLPPDLQRRVREEVQQGLRVADDDLPLVIEMEVIIGSGR